MIMSLIINTISSLSESYSLWIMIKNTLICGSLSFRNVDLDQLYKENIQEVVKNEEEYIGKKPRDIDYKGNVA